MTEPHPYGHSGRSAAIRPISPCSTVWPAALWCASTSSARYPMWSSTSTSAHPGPSTKPGKSPTKWRQRSPPDSVRIIYRGSYSWQAVTRLANPEALAQYCAMRREVGAELEVEITAATTLEFQLAVAPHPLTEVFESLRFVLNGQQIEPLEISGVHGNRIHKFDAAVGTLKVDYSAT